MSNVSPVFLYNGLESVDIERSGKGTGCNEVYASDCPYCRKPCLERSKGEDRGVPYCRFSICLLCGWWSYSEIDEGLSRSSQAHDYHFDEHANAIQTFDIQSTHTTFDVPLDYLSLFVNKHPDRLGCIHPAKFEELVAAIFNDVLGNVVESCSYGRPDRGIDIVALSTSSGERIAIQVKRYKSPIELGLIHQFCGAMIDNGFRKGVFVTKGRFRRGCRNVAASLKTQAGVEIDFIDGQKFLEFNEMFNNTNACMSAGRKRLDQHINSFELNETLNYSPLPRITKKMEETLRNTRLELYSLDRERSWKSRLFAKNHARLRKEIISGRITSLEPLFRRCGVIFSESDSPEVRLATMNEFVSSCDDSGYPGGRWTRNPLWNKFGFR